MTRLQRLGAVPSPAPAGASLERATPRPSGRPLEQGVRASMERRFAHDFSGVRVHTGGEADRAARSLDARAYAVGRDIVFRSGAYAPHSPDGRSLIAHELTHVAQQERGGASLQRQAISHPGDAAEREARSNAGRAEGSGPLTAAEPPSAVFHRDAAGIGAGIALGVSGAIGLGFTIAALAGAFSSENFSDQELTTYLGFLQDKQRPEGNLNSDNKARAVVKRWKKGAAGFTVLIVPIRILLIKEMASGYMGAADQDGILDLLREAIPAERAHIFDAIGIEQLKERFDGKRRKSLDGLIQDQETAVLSLSDAWTVAQTQMTIQRHGDGGMLRRIFDAGYKIFRFKTVFDTWKNKSDGQSEEKEDESVLGNTDWDDKKVRIRESLSDEVAASTIAHEGKHAVLGKPKSKKEKLDGEIAAREDEESFRYRHGQAVNTPSARTAQGTPDTAAIRKFVTGSEHYNSSTKQFVKREYAGEAPTEGWDYKEPDKAGAK